MAGWRDPRWCKKEMYGLRVLGVMGRWLASRSGHGRLSCEPVCVESRNRNKLVFCVIDIRLDEMNKCCVLCVSRPRLMKANVLNKSW